MISRRCLGQGFIVPEGEDNYLVTFKFQYGPGSADDKPPLANGSATDDLRRTLIITVGTDGLDENTGPLEIDNPLFKGQTTINVDENHVATCDVRTSLEGYEGQALVAWSTSNAEGGQTEQFLNLSGGSAYSDGSLWRYGMYSNGGPVTEFDNFDSVFEATFSTPPAPPEPENTNPQISAVPLPASVLFLGAGLGGFGLMGRLRRRAMVA